MKLKDAMTRDVQTISASANLEQAAKMMDRFNIGILPVMESGRTIGVITDRDLTIRGIARGLDPKHTPVSRAMTDELITVSEEQELDEAIELMKEKQIGRLLVRNREGGLAGVLTTSDAAFHCKGDARIGSLAAEISKRTHKHAETHKTSKAAAR